MVFVQGPGSGESVSPGAPVSKCRVASVAESSPNTHRCDCLTDRFREAADQPEPLSRYDSNTSDARVRTAAGCAAGPR